MNTHDLFSLKGRPATNPPGASRVSTEASPTSVIGKFDSAMEEAAPSAFQPSDSELKNESPQVGHASERFESEEEERSVDGAGPAANILLFPTPSVIIPFPALGVGLSDMANSELRIPNSTELTRNHSTDGTSEVMVPFPTTEAGGEIEKSPAPVAEKDGAKMVDPEPAYPVETANNIRTVNFNQATVPREDGPVSSLVVVAFRDDEIAESSDRSGSAQLPTGMEARENIADPFDNSDLLHQPSKGGVSVAKPLPSMGSAALPALPVIPPETTGITAARQGSGMNYSPDSNGGSALIDRKEGAPEQFPGVRVSLEGSPADFSARMAANDWQLGQLGGSLDQSVKTLSPERKDYSAAVERLSSLVRREAALVRQYHSDSMAVVLRPDIDTELFVHFSRRHGQIEVTIRCERGDTLQLTALWPQLQESLAHHKVRLAPLQEPVSNNPHVSPGSEWGNRRNGFSRHTPDKQFMDETPALATSEADSPTLRGGGGSRHRRVTTSRPGWETWA